MTPPPKCPVMQLCVLIIVIVVFRMVMVWWEVTTCLCSLNSQQDCQKHPSNNSCLTIRFFIVHKLLTVYGNCIDIISFLEVWIQSWNDTSCFSWLKQEYCKGIWWVAAANWCILLSTCSICIYLPFKSVQHQIAFFNINTLLITLVRHKKSWQDATSQVTCSLL